METVDQFSAKRTRHDLNVKSNASKEEMPLLFMDKLPSNFHQNAELAAIATFMDSADERENNDEEVSGKGSKRRQQRRDTVMKSIRRRQPYAKLTPKDRNKRKRNKATTSDIKELQLFLSMFHVS
ncbi:unnamed protein product [Peronospora destructor]|uniref:Tantalus-like domain-containing protein n=1 Tax=Peronospora destructor TaxID=86335 RepID=A0AAV0V646_9STRA|nr:unnamed protein product [Peronospora destructor]